MIKHLLLEKYKMYFLRDWFNEIFKVRGKGNKIIKQGARCAAKIYIHGNNNTIVFKKGSCVANIPIHIRGNNHYIEIGENVTILNRLGWCDILCEGMNNKIIIGTGTNIQSAHINAQETNTMIRIGKNCMLSECIIIRTSDSHPIFSEKGRINPAKSVYIEDNVWISARAIILKGTIIHSNSVIGVGSIVSHDIPANVIAVGSPAKIKKEGIYWKSKL